MIRISGRPFAAGLDWLDRAGPAATARTARRFARPWCVHLEDRTGYAAEAEDSLDGVPALAPALLDLIGGDFWMALAAGDDPGDGGKRRYALVKVRDAAVLADGDAIFDDRDAALAAFGEARALGWRLYATAGLVEGEVGELDLSDLDPAPENALRRASLARAGVGRIAGLVLLAAALGAAGFAWSRPDLLGGWIAALAGGGPAPAETEEPPPEPEVAATIDGMALIEGCRRALAENPPWLPAWELASVSCAARFADPDLSAVRPELAGRAVMTVRWDLGSGYARPLHRRIAERHLSRWYAASVIGARAWAVAPLAPVLRAGAPSPPSFLALRRAVDRGLGVPGARIEYAQHSGGGRTVRVDWSGPLSALAERVRSFADAAGLEITELDRDAAGAWRLHGRSASPEAMAQSAFREISSAPVAAAETVRTHAGEEG